MVPSNWKDNMTKKTRAAVVFPWVAKPNNKSPLYLKRTQVFKMARVPWNEQLLAIPLTFFKSFFKNSFWVI